MALRPAGIASKQELLQLRGVDQVSQLAESYKDVDHVPAIFISTRTNHTRGKLKWDKYVKQVKEECPDVQGLLLSTEWKKWELFITDCWQSLATGRLATFSLPFVDCELPQDPDETLAADGTKMPSFPYWKARFGAECVAPVVQGTLTSRAPRYSIILELDRKVRDMELPKYCHELPPENAGLNQTMSHNMPFNYRELTLLYIHQCFFTHAIQSNPSDPIKSQYAPSFLAGYRSACDLLGLVRKQFIAFPQQIARFWVLWTHAFSSAVMISSIVTHASRSKVAPAALLELKAAYDLFEKASAYGGRAVKFLPIIRRLLNKAQRVFFDTSNGNPPLGPNDIFRPSNADEEDEMSIFGGKTHVVTTKVTKPATARSPAGSARSSQSPSGSPQQAFTTTNPVFAGVHPSLISEYNGFDGHISAQISNAYHSDSASFSQTLMSPPPQHNPNPLQRQQQEAEQQRLQQEMEQRRQQELLQQQMRQQEEEEKRHILAQEYESQQRLHQQHHQSMAYEPRYSTSDHIPTHGVPAPVPVQQHSKHTLSHSRSRSNVHRMDYQEYSPEARYQYESQHHPHAQPSSQSIPHPPAHHLHSHSQHPQSQSHPQHEMYPIPPEYMQHQTAPLSPDVLSPTSPTHPHHPFSPEAALEPHSNSHPTYWSHHAPPPPSNGVVYQEQQHHNMHPMAVPHQTVQQHYTPEAAMRGIAAEDPRLQETWQSYMSKMGSSRHFLED
ncbi:hypothetical protein VKT23_008735 [Stygiomarasmius scandens]|uniref:Uncharacterized protein n=1 Tax=Marasmiellus scandens TaxID=2682957 RepID=A0ABR1JFG1_9AGAR